MIWLDFLYTRVVHEATSLACHSQQFSAAFIEIPQLSHPKKFRSFTFICCHLVCVILVLLTIRCNSVRVCKIQDHLNFLISIIVGLKFVWRYIQFSLKIYLQCHPDTFGGKGHGLNLRPPIHTLDVEEVFFYHFLWPEAVCSFCPSFWVALFIWQIYTFKILLRHFVINVGI